MVQKNRLVFAQQPDITCFSSGLKNVKSEAGKELFPLPQKGIPDNLKPLFQEKTAAYLKHRNDGKSL